MIETEAKLQSSEAHDSRGSLDAPRGERTHSVIFLAPGDVAKGRVEPISWMQTCSAYAALGLQVTLSTLKVRRPDGVSRQEIWSHYGIEQSFRLLVFPTPLDRDAPTWWFRMWAALSAATIAVRQLPRLVRCPRTLIVHARLPILIAPFAVLASLAPRSRRPRLVLETHTLPKRQHRWIVRRVDLVVVNSKKLAEDVRRAFDLREGRVLFAALGPYNRVRRLPKQGARAELGFSGDATIACYTGKMTQEHNEYLLQAAAELRRRGSPVVWLLVGGNPEILAWTNSRAEKLGVTDFVRLPGFVAPGKVGVYQAAADVLVYYMPSSMLIFPYCTPAKGYEYQASGRPIVATDIPLFGEVFGADGERAVRVVERTPEALAAAVLEVLANPGAAEAMAARAAAWASGRTWQRRNEEILQALER